MNEAVTVSRIRGVLAFVALWIGSLLGGWDLGGFHRLYEGMQIFAQPICPLPFSMVELRAGEIIGLAMSAAAIELAITLMLCYCIESALGTLHEMNAVERAFRQQDPDCHPLKMGLYYTFAISLIFGLPLGFLLPMVSEVPRAILVFVCFVSSALFAWQHLGAIENRERQHWIRVAPHFVSGMILCLVLLVGGVVPTIFVAIISDAIFFAMDRRCCWSKEDTIAVAIFALIASMGFLLCRSAIADLRQVHDVFVRMIERGDVSPEIICEVLFTGSALLGLLHYLVGCDRHFWFAKRLPSPTYARELLRSLGYAVVCGVAFASWVVIAQRLVPIHDHLTRVIVISALSLVFRLTVSGSGITSLVFLRLPLNCLRAIAIGALGGGGGILLSIVWSFVFDQFVGSSSFSLAPEPSNERARRRSEVHPTRLQSPVC